MVVVVSKSAEIKIHQNFNQKKAIRTRKGRTSKSRVGLPTFINLSHVYLSVLPMYYVTNVTRLWKWHSGAVPSMYPKDRPCFDLAHF